MPVSSKAKEAAAATAWRRIFDYIVATAAERVAVLDRLGITPAESRALTSLDPDAGIFHTKNYTKQTFAQGP